ncbi:MAG: hypothetical protein ACREL5_05625 [Gemmatimonadales bacterium]
MADIEAPLSAGANEQFLDSLYAANPRMLGDMPADSFVLIERRARVAWARAVRRSSPPPAGTTVAQVDSMMAKSDSTFGRPSPPPRPSDVAWYSEHCFRGEAR